MHMHSPDLPNVRPDIKPEQMTSAMQTQRYVILSDSEFSLQAELSLRLARGSSERAIRSLRPSPHPSHSHAIDMTDLYTQQPQTFSLKRRRLIRKKNLLQLPLSHIKP